LASVAGDCLQERGALEAILTYNRDEDKEHAAMQLEWIRRTDPTFSKELKNRLRTDKPTAHRHM